MTRDISLARYQATTSAEACQRARLAMQAHDDAMKRRTKATQLDARQLRASDERQASFDFAMNDYEEAMMNRK